MTKLKGFITDAFSVLLDVSIYHAATFTFFVFIINKINVYIWL